MDLPFFCDVCGRGELSYGCWLVHVTTQSHQEGLRLLGAEALEEILSPGVRERVVIAHDVPTWVPLINVAHYFSTWGHLRNVWYRGTNEEDASRMRILLIFDTTDGVESLMDHPGPLLLDEVAVVVERLFVAPPFELEDDYPPEDPYSAANSFGYGDEEIKSHCGSASVSNGGMPSLFDFEMDPSPYEQPSDYGGSYSKISNSGCRIPRSPRFQGKRKKKRSKLKSRGSIPPPQYLHEAEATVTVQQPVETRHFSVETEQIEEAPQEVKETPPKEDSSYEMETENEEEEKCDKLSFQEIRKSRIRMNQTLRRYFENAISRILPQLLDDLSRDATVGEVVDELVNAVENLESSETEEEDETSKDSKPNDIPLEINKSSLEKVLVDDEFQKVVEDQDGHVFVIKKKNLNQIPQESPETNSEDSESEISESEISENEKRRSLYTVTRRKFQLLWFQFLKEFNSIFWTECFGFQLESPADEDWTLPEYARVTKNPPKTLIQRWAELPESGTQSSLTFRCLTGEELSDILYKKKVWKRKFLSTHLRSLWSIVSGAADAAPHEYDEAIECVRLKSFIPFERRLEFTGQLEVAFDLREEIPKDARLGTTATLRISDESYGSQGRNLRAKKLRFLATVYERLAMKFANVRVKQWLAGCSDFDATGYNAAFKKDRKKRQGHPKWRKFRKKWKSLGMIQ